jgi:hypothetical protein
MSYFLKYLTLVLLATASASAITVPILPVTAAPDAQPAGCHQHRQKLPSHQPANYICCLAGHDSAVPQASFAPRPVFEKTASFELCAPLVQIAVLGVVEHLPFSSGDPPGTAPLRI